MKTSPHHTMFLSGLVLVAGMLSGCQSMTLPKVSFALPSSVTSLFGGDKKVDWADKDNPVVRCVCLWQPADGTWEGSPTRGFGGQVFFLDRKTARPVAVKGDVRIHVFDDFGPRENHGKAVHTFDFTKGAWNAFLVKTQFGPAYNVFIPYTRDGHHKTECALRVRLAGEEMPTIFSDMSYVKLEGADRDDSAKSVAGTKPRLQPKETRRADAIGQISRKDGVTTTSANKVPSKPNLATPKQRSLRGLPPEIEARLAELQQKKPIKLRDKPKTELAATRSDRAEGFGPPDFEAGPRQLSETGGPRRFAAPASVAPITQESHPLPTTVPRASRRMGIEDRTRHSLAPAHPLDKSTTSTAPMHNTQTAAAVFSGGNITAFDRTIREAERFAAGQNWTEAIRLVSKVDREVRSQHASWPLDRPTPSALVATWEIQRIDLAASGDQAERAARVDSRVNDYLKASKGQLDQKHPSEARRLAAVAHLISRVALQSTDTKKRAAETPNGAMPIPTSAAPVGPPTKKTTEVSLSGWDRTMQPEKSAPPAHPLAGTGGDE